MSTLSDTIAKYIVSRCETLDPLEALEIFRCAPILSPQDLVDLCDGLEVCPTHFVDAAICADDEAEGCDEARIAAADPFATPARHHPIFDRNGLPCPAATPDSYPLLGTCAHCDQPIRCADGTADWAHTPTGHGRCGQ